MYRILNCCSLGWYSTGIHQYFTLYWMRKSLASSWSTKPAYLGWVGACTVSKAWVVVWCAIQYLYLVRTVHSLGPTFTNSLFCWIHRPVFFLFGSSNRTLRQRSLDFLRKSNGTECRPNHLFIYPSRYGRCHHIHELSLKCTCGWRMSLCHT
jgi:hypothetical protein